MSRLAPLDRALVLILVPLWLVVFALGIRAQIAGVGQALVGLSVEDADQYPALTGQFSRIINPADPLADAGLREGDRLVRVGEADLRGVGTAGFTARSHEEARDLRVPLVFERGGERHETSLALAPASIWRPGLFASFSFMTLGLLLIARGRWTPRARAWFHLLICWAFFAAPLVGSKLEVYVGLGVSSISGALLFPLAFRMFPQRTSRAFRIASWLLGLQLGLAFLLQFSSWIAIAEIWFAGVAVVGIGTLLAMTTYNYRRAGAVARRQTKWLLFGVYCTTLPLGIALTVSAFDPRLGWLFPASIAAAPLLPLSVFVSAVRFNLFDIDRILSATASYNVLAVLLVSGALVAVPRIAEAISSVAGVDPGISQVAISLALAAAVIPAHRRLRPQIDRVFFKERHALNHGIAELLPTLSACSDTRELTERAGAGLQRLLRPEACVVYAGVGQSYAPVFVEGRAVPPAFEADSALIASLRGRRAPLSLSAAGRRPDEVQLGPFDRAALETLQAEVVVPVRQDNALTAFLCLGPKRSRDVYTSTDLSLLAAVAETVSQQLQRFDQEEVTREAQAMQASLRRYVPGAVADQLSSGFELASGEREVTVLFVDIRGYTGISESRRAEDIFSTVNRYTETVSRIVQKHAGSVVEFNGDGMMAVFGAPRELAHKERSAVEAGREIVEAVGALTVEDATGGQTKLSVGVGIATGEAFVGNIQAVDRMIWSAIGNTTNLAARLQGLTRDLDALLVVDRATWERAQPAAEDFEQRSEAPIRGLRKTQDVYMLPMCRNS